VATLIAEAGRIQKRLVEEQARVGTGALSNAQYNDALQACGRKALRPILNRPTLFRRANFALGKVAVTVTDTPQRADLLTARRELSTISAVADNILSQVPPKVAAEAAAEADRVKANLRNIPPLQDPAVVGRAVFLKTLKERAAMLGLGALGLGKILLIAGLALFALIVILKFVF
jgi:hypothetical protein